MRFTSKKGLSFVEIMVTISILSLGLVGVIRTLILSLERVEHFRARLYAYNIIENKISYIERILRAYKTLPFDADDQEKHRVGGKEITFNHTLKISAVNDLTNLFKLDVTLDWMERGDKKTLKRSAYLLDLRLNQ